MDWIFNGIGTAIISLIVGFIGGGAVGYKIGIKSKVSLHQKAKDNANQVQVGNTINNEYTEIRR